MKVVTCISNIIMTPLYITLHYDQPKTLQIVISQCAVVSLALAQIVAFLGSCADLIRFGELVSIRMAAAHGLHTCSREVACSSLRLRDVTPRAAPS
jgi:hypothetical protein